MAKLNQNQNKAAVSTSPKTFSLKKFQTSVITNPTVKQSSPEGARIPKLGSRHGRDPHAEMEPREGPEACSLATQGFYPIIYEETPNVTQ